MGPTWARVRTSTAHDDQRRPGRRSASSGGDGAGFVVLGGEAVHLGRRTVGPHRGRSLAVGEQGRRGGEHLRRRPVAAVESHDRRAPHQRGQPQQERRIGAVPAVDRLVRVAHHAEVGPSPTPGLEEVELQRVDVLELVDEEVAEAPPLRSGEVGLVVELRGAQLEQVVEVDHATLALLVGVGREHLGQQVGR